MNIFVCISLTPEQTGRIKSALAGHTIHIYPDCEPKPETSNIISRCEIAFGNPPADWLASSPSLQWLQLESVGFGEYASLDWPRLGERLAVTNLAGFFAEPVAESILAGVLAHYRGIDWLSRLNANRDWQGDALRPSLRTLRNASVVLFGKGDINRRVAELLTPFDCRIISFGRDWVPESLDQSLAEADAVICTVPDTPLTRGLFDKDRLGKLKRGSLFMNFGRGSLVDEDALAEAVDSGKLSGAVVDVTKEEPLPPGHRFWSSPEIILTQHTAGGTADEVDRKTDVFLANFERFLSNAPLEGRVDFTRGY